MPLQGTLDTFSLPDVLRLLAATGKTGGLHITGDQGQGSVWLCEGLIVGTAASNVDPGGTPEEMLFGILSFQSGSFRFAVEESPPSGSQQGDDVEALLRKALATFPDRLARRESPWADGGLIDAWLRLSPTQDQRARASQVLLSRASQVAEELARLERQMGQLVELSRACGAPWREVGLAMGVTAQGAHRRWTTEAKERDRQAKARVRKLAKQAAET